MRLFLELNQIFILDQDGAEPCGNSIAAHNLIRLSVYLDRQDLRAKAGRVLTAFADKLKTIPVALPEMSSALLFYHDSPTQVSLVHCSRPICLIEVFIKGFHCWQTGRQPDPSVVGCCQDSLPSGPDFGRHRCEWGRFQPPTS